MCSELPIFSFFQKNSLGTTNSNRSSLKFLQEQSVHDVRLEIFHARTLLLAKQGGSPLFQLMKTDAPHPIY
eukprot:snap_masked-scaffold_9-processed-gene-7.43-mRNA-1 protein AED:1.00 eAED:1.00 QI:0/0/0/0/1/1/2/0/70